MNASRHRRTLEAIFDTRSRAGIKWRDVEGMLKAMDAILVERAGSRVRVELNGGKLVLHKPHPRPDMDKGAVTTLRLFLQSVGKKP